MSKSIYVGNLSWNVTDEDLMSFASRFGKVESARVITDAATGRSRGFGFLDVADQDAESMIAAMNGAVVDGRTIQVNLARERGERSGRPRRQRY
ncbi:MAG TPA: RNA-binding protein [Clostridia bacterium]|nr:RNA-binding protein [Clostridia bacterium]